MINIFLTLLLFSSSQGDSATTTGTLSSDPVLPAGMNFVWMPNQVGFEELFVNAVVQFSFEPPKTDLQSTLQSRVLPGTEANKLQFLMAGTRELIQDGQGNRVAELKIQNLSHKLISKNCEGLDLELLETEAIPEGVYVGIFCSRAEDQNLRFWITTPTDVRWGETSIFEQTGKGERWRGYVIQNFTPIKNEILHATFRFYTESSNFGLKLIQKPNAELLAKDREAQEKIQLLEEEKQIIDLKRQEIEWRKQKLQKENIELQEQAKQAEERERLVKASFSLGGVMIDVKTQTTKQKSYQGYFILEGATRPLLYSLGFGGGFKYAPPIGKMSFWDLSIQLQSSWTLGDWFIRPGIGFHTLGTDHNKKKLAFRHSSIGMDLYLQYGKIHQFWLLISGSGYLPSGDSKYLSGSLGYRFPILQFLNAGPRLTYQFVDYPNAKGKFQQIMAGFDVGF